MSEMITVGDAIARTLEQYHVEAIYGVISIHNLPIADAVGQREKIRFVPARGEAGSVTMADAHGRFSGLGVALTSTGAGAGNACPGAFTAAQRGGMLRNKRVEAAAEKLRILPGEGLAAKRSPQHAIVLIEHKGTVVKIVDFEARAPGVIQPAGIQYRGVGLFNRVVPNRVILYQRENAVHRCLLRAIHRKNGAMSVDFICFNTNQMLGKID